MPPAVTIRRRIPSIRRIPFSAPMVPGYIVPWYEVKQNMHVESPLTAKSAEEKLQEAADRERSRRSVSERWLGVEEVDAIIEGVSGANRRNKSLPRRGRSQAEPAGSMWIRWPKASAQGSRNVLRFRRKNIF